MNPRHFATAAEAELAFYEALERADLDGVMEVWATDEEIVCIHPSGPRIEGFEAIRESWRRILQQDNQLRIHLSDVQAFEGMLYSLRMLCEWVSDAAHPQQNTAVFTTNAFLLTDQGWRMVLHHASPAPQISGAGHEPRDTRTVLH